MRVSRYSCCNKSTADPAPFLNFSFWWESLSMRICWRLDWKLDGGLHPKLLITLTRWNMLTDWFIFPPVGRCCLSQRDVFFISIKKRSERRQQCRNGETGSLIGWNNMPNIEQWHHQPIFYRNFQPNRTPLPLLSKQLQNSVSWRTCSNMCSSSQSSGPCKLTAVTGSPFSQVPVWSKPSWRVTSGQRLLILIPVLYKN